MVEEYDQDEMNSSDSSSQKSNNLIQIT